MYCTFDDVVELSLDGENILYHVKTDFSYNRLDQEIILENFFIEVSDGVFASVEEENFYEITLQVEDTLLAYGEKEYLEWREDYDLEQQARKRGIDL